MKQAIRALSIAIIILWIFLIAFAATAVYSVINSDMGFGEAQFFSSNEDVVVSLPFFINNNGYYDISELNVTTLMTDYNGTLSTRSETFVPLVASGNKIETAHNISIDLSDISMEYVGIFFNDGSFGLDSFITLNFANVIPVQGSINMTIPWGAPFSNLSVGEPFVLPYNITHSEVVIPVSFENHSYLDIAGMMQLEVYNDMDELVTSGQASLDVPSHYAYNEQVEAYSSFEDVSKLTESGEVHFVFETSMFTVEQWVTYG